MARMNTGRPARKVLGSGVTGLVVSLAVLALNHYLPPSLWHPVPPQIASAITVIVSFLAGYHLSPGGGERIEN